MRFNDSFRSDWDVFIVTKYIIRMEIHVKINEALKKRSVFFTQSLMLFDIFRIRTRAYSEPWYIQDL